METRLHVDRFEEMLTLGVEACKVLKEEMDGVVKDRTERIVERRSIKIGGHGTGQEGEMIIDD